MNVSRVLGLLTLAASFALSACGGGGAPTEATGVAPPSSAADTYTGPAPATADVQAFKVSFWENVRSTSRCGQCHNATSPAQMPNFARSDDVNLAYAQANTVVNLLQPSTSLIVTKVGGGHNCWLSDPSACAQILTTWISNWAGASGGGGGTQVQLTEPPATAVGNSKNFPADPTLFATYVYTPVLVQYCSKCHSPDAATPQSPFFASKAGTPANALAQAYQYAIPLMNLNAPASSRFYSRLKVDMHNCWDTCDNSAAQMLAAIQAFADHVTATTVDPSLVNSKAVLLSQGTIASGAGRFDGNVIAKYEFQGAPGSGLTAFDTSGVDPAADLTMTGDIGFVGGWGIQIGATGKPGKAQASTASSKKINDMIQSTGEYSVEAWVAPALVAADKSYMVTYSGGDTLRNFTLGQTNQNYDFLMRTSTSDLNGMPQLATPTNAQVLQATLQHVVLTSDPVNGRKIFVNGVDTNVVDPQKGGTIGNWDSTFALVLGNEVSNDRPWQGVIKMVAIHNRALTADQILQNFKAGVGQRFFLPFNVADATGVNKGYVVFTVAQYDNSSYLFTSPTFLSLDPAAKPDGIPVKGMRIGINGTIPKVGQAYIPLDTTITTANYTATGTLLSAVGTVVAIQGGPATDQFFLSFEKLGSKSNVFTEPEPIAVAPGNVDLAAAIGVRTFAQMNASMAKLTGVPTTNAAALATYVSLQQQLPSDPTLESFSSANQVGVAQLAIQYCNIAVNDPTMRGALFPGITFDASTLSSAGSISQVTTALATRVLGTGLNSQPAIAKLAGAQGELDSLVGKLCTTSACNTADRVLKVTAATCAAAMGSSVVSIN
jgi:Concanavalin A-like lectin/glucanases superfamily